MPSLRAVLKASTIKRSLYASGALDAWHRRRNRDRLTVIMFHRVVARTDPRWATSDPEYTLPDDVFAACLAFFKRHYNVVALDDVIAARHGWRPLPERALLITFDDGWSDNEEYALPALRAAGLPAVMFVVGEAVDRKQPFWQEQMITAWKGGRLDAARVARLGRDAGLSGEVAGLAMASRDELEPLRRVIAALEALDDEPRERLLAGVARELDDGVRYMITTAQLRRLAAGRVAIGAHGFTHAPLTRVDAGAELTAARARLREGLGGDAEVTTLSFPHGKFDDGVVRRAHALGYDLLFTSVPELPAAATQGPGLLGRVGFTTETVTDASGAFCPELLAMHLFRKPHAAG